MANLENKSKRHQNVKVHTKYTVEDGKVKRNPTCPKCPGSFLAQHKDRKTCGRCGYCEIGSEKKEEVKE